MGGNVASNFSFFPVNFTMIINGFSAGVFWVFFKAFSLHHIKRKINEVLCYSSRHTGDSVSSWLLSSLSQSSYTLSASTHRQKGQDLRHKHAPSQWQCKFPLGSSLSSTHSNFTSSNHCTSLTQHLRFTSDVIQCSSHKLHITCGQTILIPYSMPPTMSLREKLLVQ